MIQTPSRSGQGPCVSVSFLGILLFSLGFRSGFLPPWPYFRVSVSVAVFLSTETSLYLTQCRCLRNRRPSKAYAFLGVGAMDATKPYKFAWLGDIRGTRPFKFIGLRWRHSGSNQLAMRALTVACELSRPCRLDSTNGGATALQTNSGALPCRPAN